MIIVFSDLDGTLLDHHTYSYAEARDGLRILREQNAPLVLVSSKTYEEMRELHKKLLLDSPFVFENGGGIAYPEQGKYIVALTGMPVAKLREKISILKDLFHRDMKMLIDMHVQEVVRLTGLPEEKAKLAQERQASLPFIVYDARPIGIDEINGFNQELRKHGVWVTKGGRFFHLSSADANKGNAVKKIVDFYSEKRGIDTIETVGIGDSENDIPLLKAVDVPFLVKKTSGDHIRTGIDHVRIIQGVGPAGFTEAMMQVFCPGSEV